MEEERKIAYMGKNIKEKGKKENRGGDGNKTDGRK